MSSQILFSVYTCMKLWYVFHLADSDVCSISDVEDEMDVEYSNVSTLDQSSDLSDEVTFYFFCNCFNSIQWKGLQSYNKVSYKSYISHVCVVTYISIFFLQFARALKSYNLPVRTFKIVNQLTSTTFDLNKLREADLNDVKTR